MKKDVLNSLASLSNDEVFTSSLVANKLLDSIPDYLWSKKEAKVLNPFMKTGIFMREMVVRFDKGLEDSIPDKNERIQHILKNIIYGLPITHLTSLISRRTIYTSREANSKFSIAKDSFVDDQGNIIFNRSKHVYKNSICSVCGIKRSSNTYDMEFENYAYPFIHEEKFVKEIKKMKFDLIIGNPPYQLKDGEGGGGASAKPIYQLFVDEAIKMNPDHLMMIIPSRWFGGGKGLDKFREEMLNRKDIVEIHDYINEKVLFPSISLKGGVNYFYIRKNHEGNN